jgi:hypothetical protein
LLLVLPLLALEGEWTKEVTLVNISFADEVAGETENDGEDDGDGDAGGDVEDGEDGEGDTLNPDWGEIGNIWSPTSWSVIFLLPKASSYDSPKFKVCTVPAAAMLG